jgi:hypothetical protein
MSPSDNFVPAILAILSLLFIFPMGLISISQPDVKQLESPGYTDYMILANIFPDFRYSLIWLKNQLLNFREGCWDRR